MNPPRLILASASPRRRALLRAAGLRCAVRAPAIDETPRRGETPAAFARRAATEKGRAVADRLPAASRRRGVVVISCDTIVVRAGRILGKPRDDADARHMLRGLSGARHEVLSGLCVHFVSPAGRVRVRTRVVRTAVDFVKLTAEDIRAYVAGGEPRDKAGAYAIQGGAARFVRAIRGSHSNVIGLPLAELFDELRRLGIAPVTRALSRRPVPAARASSGAAPRPRAAPTARLPPRARRNVPA